MNPLKSFIFVLSGPSGVGKNSIITQLLELKNLKLTYCISTTTRPPRTYEQDTVHYYFTTEPKFNAMIKNNEFIEYASILNHYYGTSFKEIQSIHQKNRYPILDIDIQGGIQLKEKFHKNIISIFIKPPSLEVLKSRLMQRSANTTEEINQRLELAKKELNFQDKYDYTVINDQLDNVTSEIQNIILQY